MLLMFAGLNYRYGLVLNAYVQIFLKETLSLRSNGTKHQQ